MTTKFNSTGIWCYWLINSEVDGANRLFPEGEKERIQAFEGTVIARKGGGVAETFTVRRLSYGVGVERVFPLHSPNVTDVKVIRKGKVRRAKLYYLRGRVGKAAKVKEALK